MDTQKIIDYCYENADIKWQTAKALLKAKRYADCLFFCHLTLELVLKGKVVENTGRMFPTTHNLNDLANKSGSKLTAIQKKNLRIINTFNVAGRYDDFKLNFFKNTTASYAKKYFKISENLILWLKKQ